MLSRLNDVIHSITPHINDATSGAINKIGIISVATGGTNAIVTTAIESQNETRLTISNSVAVISIIGSVVFIIKLSADFYYARLKNKREEESHKKLMSRDTPKN